jgi:hypothetical protein
MSDDLVQFLRDRLDEDEQAIEAPETWTEFDESTQGTRRVDVNHSFERVIACTRAWRGVHIARHDPARVLREVEAKRRVLDETVPAMNGMDDRIDGEWGVGEMDPSEYESVDLLRLLALPYADHPEYQDEWRPDDTR